MELHEGKNILSSSGKIFKKCLDTSNLYKTTNVIAGKKLEKATNPPTYKGDYTEILECMHDLLDKVELEERKNVADDVLKESEFEALDCTGVLTTTVKTSNAQDIMDALMQETMAKEQMIFDSDSDCTSTDAENKIEEVKINQDIEVTANKSVIVNLPSKKDDLALSKTEDEVTNIRVSLNVKFII